MDDRGYVYVLMNPSLQGLVKIGKTTKDPEERAAELSSATGVPTPFVVAYKLFVSDCSQAEAFVHAFLEKKGYRLTDNREFFNIPINEAIDAVLAVKGHLGEDEKTPAKCEVRIEGDAGNKTPLDNVAETSAKESFREGLLHYNGDKDCLKDYKEALKHFKYAEKLGSAEACYYLGVMYGNGQGCRIDYNKATEYLKEGIRRGYNECWGELMRISYASGQKENGEKCWDKYATLSLNPTAVYCYWYLYYTFQSSPYSYTLTHEDVLLRAVKDIEKHVHKLTDASRGYAIDIKEHEARENVRSYCQNKHIKSPNGTASAPGCGCTIAMLGALLIGILFVF